MTYTDAALETAAKLASRHLRDYRLPDSAIDLIDEAGAVTRLRTPPSPEDPGGTGDVAVVVDAADIEAVVARAARIPVAVGGTLSRSGGRCRDGGTRRRIRGSDKRSSVNRQF